MATKTTDTPTTTPPESRDSGQSPVQPATAASITSTQTLGSYAGAMNAAAPAAKLPTSIEELTGEKKKGWMESTRGRLAVRAFSRGILGAAFFTWGNIKVGQDLNDYDRSLPLSQQKNMLKVLAKCFDTVFGLPIEWAVTKATGDAQKGLKAISFRPTTPGSIGADGKFQPGFTLGKEMVNRTFDFAMASIGDGLGRNIAGVFDPNVETKWLKGGKIDIKQFTKSSAHSLWTLLTKSQGEDWAVALPYVYFLRGQRNLIDKVSPGFGYDSDLGLNGGSFRLKDGKVVGNYGLEGALDLEGRFVAYNIGTLMFRESYDAVGDKLKAWHDSGYQAPERLLPKNPISAAINGAKNGARYVLKSAVKGTVFMTPAVFAFWAFRTPQSRYKGVAIDPEKGMVHFDRNIYSGIVSNNGDTEDERKNALLVKSGVPRRLESIRGDHTKGIYNADTSHWNNTIDDYMHLRPTRDGKGTTPYYYRNVKYNSNGDQEVTTSAYEFKENPFGSTVGFDPFSVRGHNLLDPSRSQTFNFMQKVKNGFDKALNPIGLSIFETGRTIRKPLRNVLNGMNFQPQVAKKFPYVWTDAASSYYPYMWAKWETARKWDPKNMVDKSMTLMDDSIYAMIDGAFGFNGQKFSEGWRGFKTALFQRQTGRKAEARRAARAEELAKQVPGVLPEELYRPVEPGFAVGDSRPLHERQVEQILEDSGFAKDAPTPQASAGKHARRLSSKDFQTIASGRDAGGFVAAHQARRAQESTLFPAHTTPQ